LCEEKSSVVGTEVLITIIVVVLEGVFKASMDIAKDDSKSGNSSNHNNSNNNSNTSSAATFIMDGHLTDSQEEDDDEFDSNDDFYMNYFADLPAECINSAERTAILQENVRDKDKVSSVGKTEKCCVSHIASDNDHGDLNCNNNARGAKKGTPAPKKVRSPSPLPQDDPELLPRVVTIVAYGDKGVSEPIEVDMNNADDFEVNVSGDSVAKELKGDFEEVHRGSFCSSNMHSVSVPNYIPCSRLDLFVHELKKEVEK